MVRLQYFSRLDISLHSCWEDERKRRIAKAFFFLHIFLLSCQVSSLGDKTFNLAERIYLKHELEGPHSWQVARLKCFWRYRNIPQFFSHWWLPDHHWITSNVHYLQLKKYFVKFSVEIKTITKIRVLIGPLQIYAGNKSKQKFLAPKNPPENCQDLSCQDQLSQYGHWERGSFYFLSCKDFVITVYLSSSKERGENFNCQSLMIQFSIVNLGP